MSDKRSNTAQAYTTCTMETKQSYEVAGEALPSNLNLRWTDHQEVSNDDILVADLRKVMEKVQERGRGKG